MRVCLSSQLKGPRPNVLFMPGTFLATECSVANPIQSLTKICAALHASCSATFEMREGPEQSAYRRACGWYGLGRCWGKTLLVWRARMHRLSSAAHALQLFDVLVPDA